jgi:hypothetical protein
MRHPRPGRLAPLARPVQPPPCAARLARRGLIDESCMRHACFTAGGHDARLLQLSCTFDAGACGPDGAPEEPPSHWPAVRGCAPPLVVGTCRVLTPANARRLGGHCGETEFDLIRLRPLCAHIFERGCSCVHPRCRQGGVNLARLGALADSLMRNGMQTASGCATASAGLRPGGTSPHTRTPYHSNGRCVGACPSLSIGPTTMALRTCRRCCAAPFAAARGQRVRWRGIRVQHRRPGADAGRSRPARRIASNDCAV